MSADWKQNSFLIATLMTAIVLLLQLPTGNGLKTPGGEVMPEEIMSDFVKPVKVHNSTLKRDDLSYDNKRTANISRNESSPNLDDQPEYMLNAFGHQLHLVLHHDTSFIPPQIFRAINILNNRVEEEGEQEAQYLGCYYKGFVQGDDQSAVSVSLCNGMTGYIRSSFGALLIQPVNQSSSDTNDAAILHKVWCLSLRNAEKVVSVNDLGLDLQTFWEQNIFSRLLRIKRNYRQERNTRVAVHGGWGPWVHLRPCSLSCGGGVQQVQRECNNPWPRNGGRYCKGTRKMYISCNTQDCPPGSLDPREQQCNNIKGLNLNIDGIDDASAKWVPHYSSNSTERCKSLCSLEGSSINIKIHDKVTDGTACSPDSFDKCVDGECIPAGCDNVLRSTAKLDKCGVCKGNNDTCEEYTGNFYHSELYKMQTQIWTNYFVTTIPKGAFNIFIAQPGYFNAYSLALLDDNDKYLLHPSPFFEIKPIDYEGVILTYKRRVKTIVQVNSALWHKLKRDLVVEIKPHLTLPLKISNDTVLLTYTYIMDKHNFSQPDYLWKRRFWTECDALCEGHQHQEPVCVSTANGLEVESKFCDVEKKPQTQHKRCNTYCKLSVKEYEFSECKEKGNKLYSCIQTYIYTGHSVTVDPIFCSAKPELSEFMKSENCSQ